VPTTDLHGLGLSTSSPHAAQALNHAMLGYLQYRADGPRRLGPLLAADPEFSLAHVLKGYFQMLGFNAANLPGARDALAAARRLSANDTWRERAHVTALERWVDGDIDGTLRVWEDILDQQPLDVLAFRLHHFQAFWHGRPDLMATQADAAYERWSPELAGWPSLLACRCFAHEELGNYAIAEASGREAIALAPGDLWAAHGVAHVMEMQGRHDEGIAWLASLEPNWEGGNNLVHHLWWHRGLYHFERREFGEVLALYDRRFRDLASQLTQANPDLYIDVQNAASMLYRLERQGIDVGGRWIELADKAEARIGDFLSVFTVPHWMMALAAAKRWESADRAIQSMRDHVEAGGDNANVVFVRDCVLPISEAILARAEGHPKRACDLMRPALDGMHRLGGSHAQQDVLEQLFLDCAVEARSKDDVAMLIDRVRRRHPVPPEKRIGYRAALALLN
jgi:tetratricopeptide (TPR) repeat protein